MTTPYLNLQLLVPVGLIRLIQDFLESAGVVSYQRAITLIVSNACLSLPECRGEAGLVDRTSLESKVWGSRVCFWIERERQVNHCQT